MHDHRELVAEARRELARLPHSDARSVRAVRRKYSKQLAQASPQIVRTFVKGLLDDAGWAERVIAFEVLAQHKGAFNLVNDRLAGQMARGLADWPSVDLYGVTVLGQAWRTGLVTDARIVAFAQSRDRWQRRLALVATVPLNIRARGGTGDPARTLRVCRMLLGDSDDMVVKAMSWALRELAKRDLKAVEEFMLNEVDRLHSRVKREVTNQLKTGLKSGKSVS
jgi:3-methyladenine DNA glycosylase AlkD